MNQYNRQEINRLLNLPSFGILANGRAGTDFIQSLFDGHPEVLTFNGFFTFYDFWGKSFTKKGSEKNLEDFLDEFLGKYLYKFKSHYDIQEQKDKLGPNKNLSIDLNVNVVKSHALNILSSCDFTSKNVLIALTASYHLSLGRNLSSLKIFLHHPHVEEECIPFLKDFPSAKLVLMTRDPRANIYSSITNYSKYYPESAGTPLIYAYFSSILQDVIRYKKYTRNIIAVKIETLDKREVLDKICREFNISYDSCMQASTWGGLLWHGDRLSQKKPSQNTSRDILRNGWEEKLAYRDLIVINFVTNKIRAHYQYTSKSTPRFYNLLIPILIVLPTGFESQYLNPLSIKKYGIKRYLTNWYFYIKRIGLFIQLGLNREDIDNYKYY